MGSGQSRPTASSQDDSVSLNTANKSGKSQNSVSNSAKSQRRNAVRYSTSPPSPPGSRRNRMLQQQRPPVQQESVQDQGQKVHNQVFSSPDADLAQEDYVSYAMAENAGFFASRTRPGTGTRGLSLQRAHATAATKTSGSGFVPRTGFSGFARRQAEAHARLNSSEMQVPSTPQSQTQEQVSSSPQYLVRPRPKGYTHTSRFREAL